MTLDIAHRGASHDAPENTMAAFELAIEQGADMIETDLHLSADGEIILYHDAAIARQPISKLTLPEIRRIDASVPILPDVLDAFGQRIPFNLEVKDADGRDYEGLEALAIEQVRARGLLGRTLFSSFRISVLERLRALCPDVRIGVLRDAPVLARVARVPVTDEAAAEGVEIARRLRAEAIHPSRRGLTDEHIERFHAAGLAVHVWTVDQPAEQSKLIGSGVDGLFTNLPGALRALLDAQ